MVSNEGFPAEVQATPTPQTNPGDNPPPDTSFLTADFIELYQSVSAGALAQACTDTDARYRDAPAAEATQAYSRHVADFLSPREDAGQHHRAALIAAAFRLIEHAGYVAPLFDGLQPKESGA